MNEIDLEKLDDLTLSVNFDLCISKSALKEDYEDLEICVFGDFVERIYKNSNEIREIFSNC